MPEKVKPFKFFFIHDSHHLRKNVKIILLLFLNLTVAACIYSYVVDYEGFRGL